MPSLEYWSRSRCSFVQDNDGTAPEGPQYDPQLLLNSQPVMSQSSIPSAYKVVFQNQTSPAQFSDISNLTCHEKISVCDALRLRKIPEAVETGKPTASEVPPNGDTSRSMGAGPNVERPDACRGNDYGHHRDQTPAVGSRRAGQRSCPTPADLMQANQLLRDQSIRDSLTGLYNHSFQETLAQLAHWRSVLCVRCRSCSSTSIISSRSTMPTGIRWEIRCFGTRLAAG